jgi:hypothetical protein
MRHTDVVDSGAGSDVASARQGLACAMQAGLTRPPIPQRGLGRGLFGLLAARSPCPALERRRRIAVMAHQRPSDPPPDLASFHEIQ